MPNLGASAVVFDSRKILLIQRKDLEVWSLPGGFVDPEETVAQAAVREVAEETGVEAELTRMVGVYSSPQWGNGGDHTVVFAAARTGGELRRQESEVKDVGFFDPDDLPEPFLWWHEQRVYDAVMGLGGSVARMQGVVWPFEATWSRKEIFEFFIQSGLSKEEFYRRYWTERGPNDGKMEVSEVRNRS